MYVKDLTCWLIREPVRCYNQFRGMFKELHICRQIRSVEMKLQVEAKRVCSLGNNQFQFARHNQFVFLWIRTICIIIIFYNLLSCKVTERTVQGWDNTERLSFWPISVFCNFSQPAQTFNSLQQLLIFFVICKKQATLSEPLVYSID